MEISVKNIVKTFGDNTVLKNVSFTARSGKAFGLLGRNGAGKTTTMRIIMDVFKPDSGTIEVDGAPINRKAVRFGYMPEERGLYPKMEIKKQLLYLAELNDMKKSDALKSIDKWLKRLEMTEYLDKKLDTLSKGNQQKIQLVSVLMINPDIVILDEPFSGLDPVNASALKDIVNDLIADGKIVIFSSHQMSYIEEFCNEIVIINEGNIELSGNLEEIRNSYPKTHISITGVDVQKIKTSIHNTSQELITDMKVNGNNLDIHLKQERDRDKLLDIISVNSFDIDSFLVVKPSLNEIFIETTGGAQ